MASTLDIAAVELGHALSPLTSALQNPASVRTLLKNLGWTLPPGISDIGLVGLPIEDVLEKLKIVLNSTPEEWKDDAIMLMRARELIVAIGALIDRIAKIANGLPTTLAGAGDYVARTMIDKELLPRLLDYLLINYTVSRAPMTFSFLKLFTIFECRLFPADPVNFQSEHVRGIIHYDRIGTLLSDPAEFFPIGYGWGTATYNAEALLSNVALVLQMLGGTGQLRPMSRKVEEAILGRSVPEAVDDPAARLIINLFREIGRAGSAEMGLSIYETRASTPGGADGGLGIMPIVRGVVDTSLPLLSNKVVLELEGGADLANGVNLIVRPNQPPILQTALFGGASSAEVRLGVGVCYESSNDNPKTLLSFPGGSKLDVKKIRFRGGVERVSGSHYDAFVECDLERLRLLLTLSGADSFVKKAVSSVDEFSISSDLALGWSNKKGLYFKGGAGLETTLPVNVDLFGVIKIDSVYLALEAKEDSKTKESAIRAVTATTVRVQLGPVSAIVERFGLQATLSFPQKGGNLGVANLDLGFKPPNGIGLVIKAQVVTGGGYLYFDFEKEQYAGVLQLEIAQKFSLTAVGLLTTKMPDGKPGFSLLVIISVRFDPGIQLGYGFSLNGLGGLLGVNRIANTKALQEGLRRGALGSILFPQNVVENAPQIISNLSAIFPPARDRFLFGPMAIIGWGGSPPLLSMEIGIILEFSESFRLMILGRLRVTLPGKTDESGQAGGSGTDGEEKEQDTPKIKLQLDTLGIFDFGSGDISLDAYLYDSTIGPFTITGGMALRASFGAKPMFLLSVGGYHPAFQVPAGFPSVERVAIGLHMKESGVEVRLQLSAYFALTSNTVQFGAHLDLYVHIAGFVEIIGLLGFDALIQFQPFGVIASFEAMVSVKVSGLTLMAVGLQVNLEGPSPWHVWGKAHFEILLMKETAEFSAIIGRAEPPRLPPPTDVGNELLKELQKFSNWSSQLPVGENPLVTFRDSIPPKDPATTPPKKRVLIHPLAELHINQRLVPLNTDPITKYGTTTPTGATTFALQVMEKGKTPSTSALTVSSLSDWFARAQFYVMTDAEKLAAPSFEEKNSGRRVKAKDGFTCGEPVTRDIVAAKLSKDEQPTSKLEAATYLDRVAHLGAAGQSPMRAAGPAKYGDPTWWDQGLTLKPAGYRVVGEEDEGPEPKARATRPAEAPSPSSIFKEAMEGMAAVAEPVMSYSAAHARATQARQRSPKRRTWVVPDIGRKRGER
ncbi:MAG: hypothetical protein CV088_09370 [Nitrospira sp. LK70]|nr:hypothetical protein [Nitrospira sp. LK70]